MRAYAAILIMLCCAAVCISCGGTSPGLTEAAAQPGDYESAQPTNEAKSEANLSGTIDEGVNTVATENTPAAPDDNAEDIHSLANEPTTENVSGAETSPEINTENASDAETLPAIDTENEPDAETSSNANAESAAAYPPYMGEWPEGLRDPYPSKYQTVLGEANPSNKKQAWYYNRNNEHQPPSAQSIFDIRAYDAYYLGDITQKTVYLTFDEGYESGFTEQILDVLRQKEVPAAFFMTQTYIRDNPALSARIAEEGHVAANHSVKHKSLPDLTDEEIIYEITEVARYYEETTGYPMSPYFRPPMGEYSERTLAITQSLGIKTMFWSFAHADWLLDDQPGKDVAFERVMSGLHNGMIILLHAVSESNAEALPEIIDAIRAQGYTFSPLTALPSWDALYASEDNS